MTKKTMRSMRTGMIAAALAGALLCLPQISLGAAMGGAQAAQGSLTAQHAEARLNGKQFKDVKVTVDNGVATLTGSVSLYAYKEQAGHKVKTTQGVTAVENEIAVAGPTVPDAKLEAKLAPKLAYNRVGYGNVFDAIGLQVNDGVVTLSGSTHDYPNRDAAVAEVATTPGVKGVIDHIQVDPVSPMDWRIRMAEARVIYGTPELNRYALNPAMPIRIAVQNGHVELFGTVDSKMDKQIAYMRASEVPGVFSVNNFLQVEGQPGTSPSGE